MKTCQPSSSKARPLAMATTTLSRTVVVVSSPLEACTMKVTANTLICAKHSAMSRLGNFHSSNFRSSLGTMNTVGSARSSMSRRCELCRFKARSRSSVIKKISNESRWIIHLENLPRLVCQPVRPRDETGSRLPTASRPSAFSCGVFPRTRGLGGHPSGKQQRRMIDAVKDGA
jgi:hypothetical protein